jgi:hypothetical protein
MEKDVLQRLKPLLDAGRIEPAMFFRVCALMGVSFAAAASVAASSPAFAGADGASGLPSGYAEVVDARLMAYLDVAKAHTSGQADPFDDKYWVKRSGEPFPKFDKAPDLVGGAGGPRS